MNRIPKALRTIWAAFVGLSVCLGFLVNSATGKDQLSDSVGDILPIAAALLPYIAIAGAVGFGLRILVWLIRMAADRLRGGPERRRFKAMKFRISRCRTSTESLIRPESLLMSPQEWNAKHTEVLIEWRKLARSLASIGIDVPSVNVVGLDERNLLTHYLANLEIYSEDGDIQSARLLAHHLACQ